jgi:uncharacterized protein YqgC (DUF456 family)
MLKYLQIAGAFALIVVGVAGLFLPIIPGVPLLIAGAAILGPRHPIVRPFSVRRRWWRRRRAARA